MAGAALAVILWVPLLGLRALACGVAALAAHEYERIVAIREARRREVPLLLVVALTCWWSSEPVPSHLLLLLLFGLVWVGLDVVVSGVDIGVASARFFGPWYLGLPLGLLVGVQRMGGARATLLLLATVVLSDTAQYYSGRAFGRRLLAPAISPKKTVEGAIGGLVAGPVLMALAGARLLPGHSRVALAGLGLCLVLLGIGGDLFESRLKRAAGVKDSSSLIPGHGGVLDRIDALLFVIPPFYLFLRGIGTL